jgi:hypothetical protein
MCGALISITLIKVPVLPLQYAFSLIMKNSCKIKRILDCKMIYVTEVINNQGIKVIFCNRPIDFNPVNKDVKSLYEKNL